MALIFTIHLQAALIVLGPEMFDQIITSNKMRCKGAVSADKVKVFRAVGLRPKSNILNKDTVSQLEYLFQLATVSEKTWDLLIRVCKFLHSKKKNATITTFKCFQGCTDSMKQELLNGLLSGSLSPKDLRRQSDHCKAVEKVFIILSYFLPNLGFDWHIFRHANISYWV